MRCLIHKMANRSPSFGHRVPKKIQILHRPHPREKTFLPCKKLFIVLEKNSNRLKKSNIPRLIELAKKYLDKELLKQIETETIKLAEEILKTKQK